MENNQHGGVRNGQGRKSKAEEQKLIETLTPLMPQAFDALKNALNNEEQWAVKLSFEYFYGKPKQQLDVTSDGKSLAPTSINFTDAN